MDISSNTSSDFTDMDLSNYSFINEKWIIKPASTIILESTIFLPVVIFGIFGNVLSIYVICKNYHICTPTNILIGNMALADLLSLLVHPWIFLVYDFFQNYQLGVFGCKSEAAIECTVLLTSVISVSAISYDRLTAILLPQESKLTKRSAKIVIAVTWMASFLISSPLIFFRNYKERQWKDFLEKFCSEDTFVTSIYWHVIITVLVWLPLSIQLICYISISIKLHKYEKIVLKKLELQVNYKKKAVRMMFAMILTFLICHIPFTALIFYRDKIQSTISESSVVQNMANGTYHNFWFMSKYFIFIKAAINPIIYSVTNEKFQRCFKTTQLAKWLFPTTTNKENKTFVPKDLLKTAETSTHIKRSLFFIFKRKQKPSTAITIVPSEVSDGKQVPYLIKSEKFKILY